jgi:transcription elongation factor S-II
MATLLNSPLLELTRALEKATTLISHADATTDPPTPTVMADLPRALDILGQLMQVEKVTADELRVSKAGLLLAKLSKSSIPDVSVLAKQIVSRWKAQVLPPSAPTGVDQAKAAASAAAQSKASLGVTNLPRKIADGTESKEEGEDSDDSERKKKKAEKRKLEKESQSKDAKKKKSDVSPSPSPTPNQSAVKSITVSKSSSNATLSDQHPDLATGSFALFHTDDPLRDKMQLILWQAIGEPPQAALDQIKAQQDQGTGQDLTQYKSRTSIQPAPSPSPPPIDNVIISSPVASGSDSTSGTAASAGSSHPSGLSAPPVFRTRQQLAYEIEEAMYNKGNGAMQWSNSTWYKQKYRDLAPQLKDPKNEDLNVSLFLGKISPLELITLSLAALAPAAMKEKRAKEAAWSREAARSDIGNDAAATDLFQCDVCKERKCTYFQMQTRGADEPMTIFVWAHIYTHIHRHDYIFPLAA